MRSTARTLIARRRGLVGPRLRKLEPRGVVPHRLSGDEVVPLDCDARAALIAAAQPVDLGILAALIGDDEAAITEVLQSFRQSAEHSQEALASAMASNAMFLAAQTAHNLKSAARAIGASRLGEICAVIEEMADAGKTADLRSFLPQFRTEMNAVSIFLESRQQM